MCKLIYLLWIFILSVLILDVAYAIKYKDTISEWEANSFSLWIVEVLGFYTAIGWRIGTTLIAMWLCLNFKDARIWGSVVVFLIHLWLLVVYMCIVA